MSKWQKPSAEKKQKSEEALLSNPYDFNHAETTRPFFPSFDRFLLMSMDNYRSSQPTQVPNPKFIPKPENMPTQISDFILPTFQQPVTRDATQPNPSQETDCKHPRSVILNQPVDSVFDSDVESDNIYRQSTLLNVSKMPFHSFAEKERVCFLKSSNEAFRDNLKIQFSLSQVLDLLNDKLEEGKNVIYEYSCKFCGTGFKTGCGLGGHVSKVHMGLKIKPRIRKVVKDFKHFDKERSKFFRKFKK